MKHSVANLKFALNEIKEILDKYDLAALISVHGLAGTAGLLKINPSYSCAKFTENNSHIRINNMNVGAQEEKKESLEDTLEMLRGLSSNAGMKAIAFSEALQEYEDLKET